MRGSRYLRTTAFLIFCAGFLSANAAAIDATNLLAGKMLSGMVRDSNGKPLEGVTVSARHADRTFTTSVFTDDHGNYIFPILEGGRYRLWVQAVGFGAARAELSLDPG